MNGEERTLIIGIGSDFGDDRLGPIVVERMAERLPTCKVRRLRSPLDLFDCLADVNRLDVVDACRGAGLPGTIIRRDWPAVDLTSVRFSGTHDFGLLDALRLADRLQQLPQRVTIWSIEAADEDIRWSIMEPLSPAVADAAEVLINRMAAEIDGRHSAIKEPSHHA